MKTLQLSILAIGLLTIASCTETSTDSSETEDTTDQTDKESEDPEVADTEKDEPVEKSITYGIDISKYQGNEIDLMDKADDSLSFIICRSSEGVTYTDPKFQSNWSSIKEKGFIRGAYHFYRSDDNPSDQAANYINTVGTFESTDLPPLIDFEEESIAEGSDKQTVITDLLEFIQDVEKKTGRVPMIYTDINIGNSYLTSDEFAKYPLWIADYSSGTEPRMPGAWEGTEWVLWQQSDDYVFDNIQNDFDKFNGSIDQLKDFITKH